MSVKPISEQQFAEFLETKLGTSYSKALKVFHLYGEKFSFDVTNVLLQATEKKKVDEVLTILENHWKNHLQCQHPALRGAVEIKGINLTQKIMEEICEKILGLEPIK